MKKIIFILSCFLFLYSCKKPILEATQSCDLTYTGINYNHPKAIALQSLMNEYVAKGIPGMALLIRDSNGLWIGSSGKADIANSIDYLACNTSRVASITKPMVVTSALILAQQGLLNIDSPLATYLSEDVVNNIENAKIATIRQCMNHTSGIFDHVGDLKYQTAILNDPTHKWTEEELVKFAYGHKAYFAPGENVKYSNINTILVAMCINKVTGKNHGYALHSLIFSPTAMIDTRYYSFDDLLPQTVHGYFDLNNNGNIEDVSNFNTGLGHTAVYSTVWDLHLFIEALLRSKTLVNASTLTQMQQWIKVDDTTDYSLGLFRKKYNTPNDTITAGIGHTGGEFGYSGKMFYYPYNDMTIVSLCNYGTNIDTKIGNNYHEFYIKVEAIMKN